LSDCLLICSLKRAIERSLFFALFNRETKRAIALSLFQKERRSENEQKMSDFPNRSFFAQKKERSLIFKMSECPTLIHSY